MEQISIATPTKTTINSTNTETLVNSINPKIIVNMINTDPLNTQDLINPITERKLYWMWT